MSRKTAVWVAAMLVVPWIGCGGDGRVPVTGTVTWDGTPIEKGHIIFTPVNPSIGPDASAITNGTFSLRATTGEKRVEVFADRPVGEPDPTMNLQRYEQFIPTRYNEATELTADIAADGENRLTFPLESRAGDTMAGTGAATSVSPNRKPN